MTMRLNHSLIDGNAFIGRSNAGSLDGGDGLTAEALLAEMDRVGVAEAVVYHIVGREYAPAMGNQMLVDAVRTHPRLHPAWIVLPPFTGEQPPTDELVARMREEGVRVARMFPSTDSLDHRFAVREWCVGPVLAALEEAGIPLQLDYGLFRRGEPPWDDIVEVCQHHPDLPVMLMDVQGRNNRTLYALLDRFEQLSIQTGGLNVHRGIEDVCLRFGADRLVFGSGFPGASMGAARFDLDRALVSEAERAAIGAGNLRRLLTGAGTVPAASAGAGAVTGVARAH
jgi:predicted TIM-barrel fold metal-dependent hydrolase